LSASYRNHFMVRSNLFGNGKRKLTLLCSIGVQAEGAAASQHTPSGAVKEVILRVTERAQKEVIARVGLGFGRCYP
jgi:hypothetical protein